MNRYTVKPGKQFSKPTIFNFCFSWKKQHEGAWKIILEDGWEYVITENPKDQKDWLKLCGDAFSFNKSKNSILLAVRHIPGQGIFVSPYYNVSGENFYWRNKVENWPMMKVETGKPIYFSYRAENGLVTTNINYNSKGCSHKFDHSGIGIFRQEVGFYFGGTSPVPADNGPVTVLKERIKKPVFDSVGNLSL